MKSIRIGNTKVLNIAKLSCWPAEVPWMKVHYSNSQEFARITRNDHPIEQEWSIHPRSGVDS